LLSSTFNFKSIEIIYFLELCCVGDLHGCSAAPKELHTSFSGGNEDTVGWLVCTEGLAPTWSWDAAGQELTPRDSEHSWGTQSRLDVQRTR